MTPTPRNALPGLALTALALAPVTGQEVVRDGASTLVKQHGLYVMHLKGDEYEVARAHVALLGEDFYRGFFPIGVTNVRSAVRGIVGGRATPEQQDRLAGAVLFDSLSLAGEDDAAIVRGVADASRYTHEECRRAYLGPDAQHVLVGTAVRLGFVKVHTGMLDTLGCSSIAVFGDRTTTGRRIFGRNQDFAGLGRFDGYPCVQFVEPTAGLRYVALTPAGVTTAGITAMNERGVAIGLHSALTKSINRDGVPILTAIHRVIRRCPDIDAAIALLEAIDQDRGFISGWLLHINDRKDGVARAAVIGFDGDGFTVNWRKDGTSALTNMYFGADRRDHEMHVTYTTSYHSIERQKRLEQMLAGERQFDVGAMADLMRDRVDPTTGKATSYSPWILAAIDQTKAAIFEPDDLALWVAIDRAPVTSGRFVKLSMAHGFDGTYEKGFTPETLGAAPPVWEQFPGYRHYKDAFIAYHQEGRHADGLTLLEKAAATDDCPYYDMSVGVVALKLGDLQKAERALTRALAHDDMLGHHRHLLRFVDAVRRDITGDRAGARKGFRSVAEDPKTWPTLRRAARSWIDAAFPKERVPEIQFHLKYMDGFWYPTR